jgi:ribosome-binding factor A
MALSHRVERIAEQVREELSQMLATEVSDPGVGLVTVTRVKVTADLSLARAYWTVLGEGKERTDTAKALNRAVPYLRHLLSQRLTLRRAPELKFQYDESVAAHDRIERIIHELHVEREEHPELNALVDAPAPAAASSPVVNVTAAAAEKVPAAADEAPTAPDVSPAQPDAKLDEPAQ